MAMKKPKENKFAAAIAELDEAESKATAKTAAAVKSIAGEAKRKQGRPKGAVERKTLPTYIPVELYEQFEAINKAQGISNNAAICLLVREYVEEKKGLLG